jgi:hypothetical protein
VEDTQAGAAEMHLKADEEQQPKGRARRETRQGICEQNGKGEENQLVRPNGVLERLKRISIFYKFVYFTR